MSTFYDILIAFFICLNLSQHLVIANETPSPIYPGDHISDLDIEIRHLKTYIKSNSNKAGISHSQLALIWEKLGLLILQKIESPSEKSGVLTEFETVDCYKNALKIAGDDDISLKFRLHIFLGSIFCDQNNLRDALNEFSKASVFTQSPSDKSLLDYLKGKKYSNVGLHADAITLLQKLLIRSPEFLMAYLPMVESQLELDVMSFSEWENLYKRMKKDVKKWMVHQVNKKGDDQDVALDRINKMKVNNEDMYWALYLVADKIKEFESAWEYLEKAHDERRKSGRTYDKSVVGKQTAQIKHVFKPGFWQDVESNIGVRSNYPIFLIGMVGSGTSLLEAMLAAHPEIYGSGDRSVFGTELLNIRDEIIGEMSKPPYKQDLAEVVTKEGNKVIQYMKEFVSNDTLISNDKKLVVKHFIDKGTHNFRTIGMLHYVFPEAIIININRDPLDNLKSCYTNKQSNEDVWTLNQNDAVFEYMQYLEVMDHYRTVLPSRILDVSYEELVISPQKVVTEILTVLGLKWSDNILEFQKHLNRSVLLKQRIQLSRGLYPNSIGSWRKYSEQLQPIITGLSKYLPTLKVKKLVPYTESMNWNLDIDFPYPTSYNNNDVNNNNNKITSKPANTKSKKNKKVNKNKSKKSKAEKLVKKSKKTKHSKKKQN